MNRRKIAFVIPAYNEAATIAGVVESCKKYGTPFVVDDGSEDGTAEIARSASAHVVVHSENRGYAEALSSGINAAYQEGFEFAVTLDGDGQHRPEIISSFLDEITEGAQLVIGCRDEYQRLAERVFALVSAVLWGIQDPLCGMKAYDLSLLDSFGPFEPYEFIGTEFAIKLKRSGVITSQVRVLTKKRIGVPRFGVGFRTNYRILSALCGLLLRMYLPRFLKKAN